MKKIIGTIFVAALSFSVFAEQNDTMFIHKGQTIFEFAAQDVDSITPVMGADAAQDSLFFFRDDAVVARFRVEEIDSIIFYRAEVVLIPTPEAPTPDAVTWTATLTLADVQLPNGWTWVDPTTALFVGENQPFYANFELVGYVSAENVEILVTVNPAQPPIPMTNCNQDTPGWGSSLGTITWGGSADIDEHARPISGSNITQIWSGVVSAEVCSVRNEFNGGSSTSTFNADCRSNPNHPGDLFSWCAVVRFANQFCPYPWRVPTRQDFIDLDRALGGPGSNRQGNNPPNIIQFINTNYISSWGGAFGGRAGPNLNSQGTCGYYWSQSEAEPFEWEVGGSGNAFVLFYSTAWPQINPDFDPRGKHVGKSLRCVK